MRKTMAFLRGEYGQALTEYALILVFVSVAVILASTFGNLATAIGGWITTVVAAFP